MYWLFWLILWPEPWGKATSWRLVSLDTRHVWTWTTTRQLPALLSLASKAQWYVWISRSILASQLNARNASCSFESLRPWTWTCRDTGTGASNVKLCTVLGLMSFLLLLCCSAWNLGIETDPLLHSWFFAFTVTHVRYFCASLNFCTW